MARIFHVIGPSRPLLAGLAILCLWQIEPLPDKDQEIDWLAHRKSSQSLLAVGLSGAFSGAISWVSGQYVIEPVSGVCSHGLSECRWGLSWWMARLVALDTANERWAGTYDV